MKTVNRLLLCLLLLAMAVAAGLAVESFTQARTGPDAERAAPSHVSGE